MATNVMEAVWQHSESEGTVRLVMLAIADSANRDTWECWPSVDTLASMCKVSRRTVQRSIREMEQVGELSVLPPTEGRKGNTYRVEPSAYGGVNLTPVSKVRGDIQSRGGVTPVTKRGDIAVTPKPLRDPSIDPSEDPPVVPHDETDDPPRQPTDIQQIVASYCDLAKIEKVANYPRAAKEAKQLLDAGVTVGDIPDLFRFVSTWAQGVDLRLMFGQVDKWRASQHSGAPPKKVPRPLRPDNGQPIPYKFLATDSPNPYANGTYAWWIIGEMVNKPMDDWFRLNEGKKPTHGKALGGLDSLEDVGRVPV